MTPLPPMPSDGAASPQASLVRRAAERVLPTLAVVATVALPWAVRADLPDPVATHWGFDGRPDASMPFALDAILPALLVLGVATLPFRAARRADRAGARALVALAHAIATLLLAVRVLAVEANRGAADWTAAGSIGAGAILIALAVAVPAGALGWVLSAWRPDVLPTRRSVAPMVLVPGEALVWHGAARGRLATLLPLCGVAVAVVAWLGLPAPEGPTVAGAALLAAVAGALTLTAHVTVGPMGIVVRLGPLPWPRVRVPLAEVEAVEVEDVEPMAHGGWGWRVRPGVRAIIVRRGEGMRVTRRGRPTLVVTVDGADEGARVLAAHLGSRA